MKKTTAFLFLLFAVLHVKPQYNSVFWKISGNGLRKPSYLFGTMHVSDRRVFENAKKATPYLSDVKAYAMELDPDKIFDISLMAKIMMGRGYSIKKMMPAQDYAFLDSLVRKQMGVSLAGLDNMEPVFFSSVLESMEMGLNDDPKNKTEQFMDMFFYDIAKEESKKIIGIETVDEQLNAVNTLSYEEQAKELSDEIRSIKNQSTDAKDLLNYYITQNLDSLGAGDTTMPSQFYKALVTDRNVRMADRIANFIRKQPTFIAIGALHLPFADGVITLLRQKGFTVEPVLN